MRLDKEPEHAELVNHLLQRAFPDQSEVQIQAIIDIYEHPGAFDAHWYKQAVETLNDAGFKPKIIAHLVDGCIAAKNPQVPDDLAEALRTVNLEDEEIEKKITDAYVHRANQYKYDLKSNPDYEEKLRELLERAGMDDDSIDKAVREGKKGKYAEGTIERARRELEPHEVDGSLKDYLKYIDTDPEYERTARSIMEEAVRKESDARLDHIRIRRTERYGEFKLRCRLIRAMETLVHEVRDMDAVHYHCRGALNQAITLLATDDRQLGGLEQQAAGGESERFGIDNKTMQQLHQSCQTLQTACGNKMHDRLNELHVKVHKHDGEKIRFDASRMLEKPGYWAKVLLEDLTLAPEMTAAPPAEIIPLPAPPRAVTDLPKLLAGIDSLDALAKQLHGIDPTIGMDVQITLSAAGALEEPILNQLGGYLESLQKRQESAPGFPKCVTSLERNGGRLDFTVKAEQLDVISPTLRLIESLARNKLSTAVHATGKFGSIEVTLTPVDARSRDQSYKNLAAIAQETGFDAPPDRAAYPFTRLGVPVSITLHRHVVAQENALPRIPRHASAESAEMYQAMNDMSAFESHADRLEKTITPKQRQRG